MRHFHLFIASVFCLLGCTGRQVHPEVSDDSGTIPGIYTRYASGFRVYDHGAYKQVEVTDPWQQSKGQVFSYVLAPGRDLLPDSLKNRPFIKTPVRRVIALSTTHLAMIDQLERTGSIVGLSGADYVFSPEIRRLVESGAAVDVGYGPGLDFERIVRLEPDVLFLYGVEGNVMTTLEKLRDLGIPAVFCGEYLEAHPLGKAEWIRFFSLFYNMEEQSAVFFGKLDSTYNALATLASEITARPVVLSGLPWKDAWYMAGGKSFAARLIADAGGSYLWGDNSSTQAIPLDLESVYMRAIEADIWINPGAAGSLDDILLLDGRLGELEVLQEGRVFNNNARVSDRGGNDYWESGTLRPDLILADLIEVFHPGLLPDHQFVYYRQLK